MKTIPRIPLDGATVLTPAQMNAIHFETGLHSPSPTPPASPGKTERGKGA